jgi:hypothetical protein
MDHPNIAKVHDAGTTDSGRPYFVMEKDRTRRYETARDFARDIQRYLDDEPVEACPPSAIYRLKKFTRRNRTAVLSMAVCRVCPARHETVVRSCHVTASAGTPEP